MKYKEMSDFEVNAAVARSALWRNRDCEQIDCDKHRWICRWTDGARWHVFDPCNNPSDAWPIMEQYGIATIVENGILVGATNNSQEFYEPYGSAVHSYLSTNALRAAMIVFLMMRDQQCQKN